MESDKATLTQVGNALREHSFSPLWPQHHVQFDDMPMWVRNRIALHMTYVVNGEVSFCRHTPINGRRVVPLCYPRFSGCQVAGCAPTPDYCDGCAELDTELYGVSIKLGRWHYVTATCSWCLWQERPATVA